MIKKFSIFFFKLFILCHFIEFFFSYVYLIYLCSFVCLFTFYFFVKCYVAGEIVKNGIIFQTEFFDFLQDYKVIYTLEFCIKKLEMSFQSLDFLLKQAEESDIKSAPKKSGKLDLQTPFGLNDLMFDDNELYSCDQNISSSMSLLHLDDQKTDECSNISDYISKHLSLLSTNEPKLPVVEHVKNVEPKLPLSDNNDNCVNGAKSKDTITITTKPQTPIKNGYNKKYKIFRTKSLAKVRKSPLEKPDTGLSLTMGRRYPKSSTNLINNYLCNVLIDTRSRGFQFNTPSPDESVLSWMDIVRQMPSK